MPDSLLNCSDQCSRAIKLSAFAKWAVGAKHVLDCIDTAKRNDPSFGDVLQRAGVPWSVDWEDLEAEGLEFVMIEVESALRAAVNAMDAARTEPGERGQESPSPVA